MPVPPALSRPHRRPPNPQNPPTDIDLAEATSFEMACTLAFDNGDLDAAQVSAAVLYKQAVINSAAPNMMAGQEAPPPWFAHALEHAIGPLRNDIMSIRNDITNMQADIQASQQRQADSQRCAARAYNWQVQLGDRSPFEEVPWRNGTYPWGFMFHNQPLPELTSTEVVRALDDQQSQQYYQGYYPGVNVPENRNERDKATLIAIGVPAMVAGIAFDEM